MNLGRHYIALAVKDMVASKEFYEKLGFTADPTCGGVEQHWIILTQGDIVVGLYQGMFPTNILTFNPTDARSIYHDLEARGLKFETAANIENESGPCHFMLADPDGNPILVDQHF